MKNLFLIIAMLLVSMLATAQKQDIRIVPSFSKIEVTDGLEVSYTTSGAYSVIVEGRDNKTVGNIETTVKNNTLKIARTNGGFPVKVMVTAPTVKKIKATSKAKINILNEFTAPQISLTVSTGASVTGMLITDKLIVAASGKSFLNLNVTGHDIIGRFSERSVANIFGSVSQARFTTEGGAVCNARKLEVIKLTINATDDSAVFIDGSGKLNLNVSQNGKVAYSAIPETLKIASNLTISRKKELTLPKLLFE